MMNDVTLALAKKLWDYHHMNHALEKADCIFVLGSHDLRVAERAAQLYLRRMGAAADFFRWAWQFYKRYVDRNRG